MRQLLVLFELFDVKIWLIVLSRMAFAICFCLQDFVNVHLKVLVAVG